MIHASHNLFINNHALDLKLLFQHPASGPARTIRPGHSPAVEVLAELQEIASSGPQVVSNGTYRSEERLHHFEELTAPHSTPQNAPDYRLKVIHNSVGKCVKKHGLAVILR
jgi:hypothetical protein